MTIPEGRNWPRVKMRQACWPIWHHSWDAESCWWRRSWAGKTIDRGCFQQRWDINALGEQGEALNHCNYRGLKLTDQVMKLLERVLDFTIHKMAKFDGTQYGFVPVKAATNAIFIVRQLLGKYITANKPLNFAFINLAKALDHVPRSGGFWGAPVSRNGLYVSKLCAGQWSIQCRHVKDEVLGLRGSPWCPQ